MYAVIKTGGKQYRVQAGEKIKVEQIPADVGSQIVLDQVLMVGSGDAVTIGQPLVAGALVNATVVSQGRHDKVTIFKMRRRKKNYAVWMLMVRTFLAPLTANNTLPSLSANKV